MRRAPAPSVEVLTPDFLRKDGAIEIVMAAQPDVFNHNLETVPRLYLDGAAGRALFRVAAAAGAGQGTVCPKASPNPA